MIKIIKGTYGFRDGNKVVPKKSSDPPFSLPPEKERRLVNAGVAKYVGGAGGLSEGDGGFGGAAGEDMRGDIAADDMRGAGAECNTEAGYNPGAECSTEAEYNSGMKLSELKQIALDYGADQAAVSKAQSKAKVIELIEAAKNAAGNIGAAADGRAADEPDGFGAPLPPVLAPADPEG